MLRVQTHLFHQWTLIAIRHEAEAWRMRGEAATADVATPDFAQLMSREFEAALVGICAVSFAIDALYSAAKEHIPIPPDLRKTWKDNGTPRHAQIFETLKRGFDLGEATSRWRESLEWLFDLRNEAVHFEGEPRDVVPHPTGVNVAVEQQHFSADSTTRAVTFLVELLRIFASQPNSKLADLVHWVQSMRPGLEVLADGFRPDHSADARSPVP